MRYYRDHRGWTLVRELERRGHTPLVGERDPMDAVAARRGSTPSPVATRPRRLVGLMARRARRLRGPSGRRARLAAGTPAPLERYATAARCWWMASTTFDSFVSA